LSSVAKFEVAAVTGANSFFSLRASDIDRYHLGKWVRPLLARSNQAPGIHFTEQDLEANIADDRVAFLFDSSLNELDRGEHVDVDQYLKAGETQELHKRYKCRIREPWYRIPHIRHSSLLLSKRCHYYPRAIFNDTPVVTTDTIYRGRITSDDLSPEDFVAGFHNSLTLLSAELEGRSFGGGVLELVPSEVGKLVLIRSIGIGAELPRLDKIVREISKVSDHAEESLVWETDLLLQKQEVGVTAEMLDRLREAWHALQRRRLDRSGTASI
jgi:adenine-specific DNA methylase